MLCGILLKRCMGPFMCNFTWIVRIRDNDLKCYLNGVNKFHNLTAGWLG